MVRLEKAERTFFLGDCIIDGLSISYLFSDGQQSYTTYYYQSRRVSGPRRVSSPPRARPGGRAEASRGARWPVHLPALGAFSLPVPAPPPPKPGGGARRSPPRPPGSCSPRCLTGAAARDAPGPHVATSTGRLGEARPVAGAVRCSPGGSRCSSAKSSNKRAANSVSRRFSFPAAVTAPVEPGGGGRRRGGERGATVPVLEPLPVPEVGGREVEALPGRCGTGGGARTGCRDRPGRGR